MIPAIVGNLVTHISVEGDAGGSVLFARDLRALGAAAPLFGLVRTRAGPGDDAFGISVIIPAASQRFKKSVTMRFCCEWGVLVRNASRTRV